MHTNSKIRLPNRLNVIKLNVNILPEVDFKIKNNTSSFLPTTKKFKTPGSNDKVVNFKKSANNSSVKESILVTKNIEFTKRNKFDIFEPYKNYRKKEDSDTRLRENKLIKPKNEKLAIESEKLYDELKKIILLKKKYNKNKSFSDNENNNKQKSKKHKKRKAVYKSKKSEEKRLKYIQKKKQKQLELKKRIKDLKENFLIETTPMTDNKIRILKYDIDENEKNKIFSWKSYLNNQIKKIFPLESFGDNITLYKQLEVLTNLNNNENIEELKNAETKENNSMDNITRYNRSVLNEDINLQVPEIKISCVTFADQQINTENLQIKESHKNKIAKKSILKWKK